MTIREEGLLYDFSLCIINLRLSLIQEKEYRAVCILMLFVSLFSFLRNSKM